MLLTLGLGGNLFHWRSPMHSRCAMEELSHLLAWFWHVSWCPCLEGIGGSFHVTEYKATYCFSSRNGSPALYRQRAGFWSSGLPWGLPPMCKEQNNLLYRQMMISLVSVAWLPQKGLHRTSACLLVDYFHFCSCVLVNITVGTKNQMTRVRGLC